MKDEFKKYARSERGISSLALEGYARLSDSYINPTIIEERKLNVASMDVFSRLMMDRIIFLGVPIDDDVANIIQAQLLFLASTDPGADISLYLNTPGGQVTSGLGIYDTMQLVSPDVATICTGMAASMGSVLLCAGAKGKRSCLPHSKVLIHQPLGGAQGQASDILIAAREIEKTRKELYDIISAHSGQPYDKVFADADRDYWMSAEEAKAYGMVDEILTRKKEMASKRNNEPLRHCMFCGRSEKEVPFLLQGLEGCICSACVEIAKDYLQEIQGGKKARPQGRLEKLPKPAEIKAFLDQYVIGQDRAKKLLAVSVYNH